MVISNRLCDVHIGGRQMNEIVSIWTGDSPMAWHAQIYKA